MANNSGNLFKKSLGELKEGNKDNIKAKFWLFAKQSMTPDRPASARPLSSRPANISLKVLIERAASRAATRPIATTVARPASRTAATRQTVAATATAAISLSQLNPDIMGLVGEQLIIAENSKYTLEKYKFVDGIPEEAIEKYPARLLQNRNALYYLTENAEIVDKKKVYFWLSSNTNPVAIELIKKALEDDENTRINWEALCQNPSAAEILLNPKYRGSLDWDAMSKNTNPKVIIFLGFVKNNSDKNPEHINWENLSANESPEAIALLFWKIKKDPWSIPRQQITRNSHAMGILKRYTDKVTGDGLSANTAESAFKLLEQILEKEPKDINWASLSANPSVWAYIFLQKVENKKHIRWDMVSKNTSKSAIELLMDRIEYENGLSEAVYKALPKNQKIDWLEVSRNPSAIELIKARIKYESGLIQTNLAFYVDLKPNEKISYEELASNPSIFVKVGRTRPVAAPAAARRTSPVQAVLVVRPSSARAASRSSQAARAARAANARVANNPEHTKKLEELRAFHQARRQLNKHPQAAQIPTASQAGLPTPPVYRTTPRTPRVAALTATRTGVRDIGRPKLPPKARASRRSPI
jgi:hypothetical protein